MTGACGAGGGSFDVVQKSRSGWRRDRFGTGRRGLEAMMRLVVGINCFTALDRSVHVFGWVFLGLGVWFGGEWDVG